MAHRTAVLVLISCLFGLLKTSANSSADAAALRHFISNITKDPYGALDSWTKDNDQPCTWLGISCNTYDRVVSVLLLDKLIEGTLTSFLEELSFLEILSLHNNSFSGPLPSELGSLHNLKELDLNHNMMSGEFPQTILDIPHLAYVDIIGNNFEGTISIPTNLKIFKYEGNLHLQVLHGGSAKRQLWKPTVETLVAALVALILLCGFLFHLRNWQYKSFKKSENQSGILKSTSESQSVDVRRFSLRQLRAATKNFRDDYVLGSGGFGTVYRAVLPTGEIIALKRANKELLEVSNVFQNEVKLLSRVHHRNLANLIGFCEESYERILVYEYVPNGSLLEHLSGMQECLTWRQRVRIAIGAAKGLAYLHEGCAPPIIHRDIKPSNILLGFDYEAKVSDFGLSKHGPSGDASHVSTLVKGTFGYLDPHYFLSYHLTTSSDVYSFGVILLQLVTARPAVDQPQRRSQYNVISWASTSIENGRLENIIDPYLAENGYDRNVMLRMAQLGLRCTSSSLKLRPSISSVSHELETALREYDTMLSSSGKGSPLTTEYTSPQMSLSDFVSPISR